jgi:hypothetical protein
MTHFLGAVCLLATLSLFFYRGKAFFSSIELLIKVHLIALLIRAVAISP